MKVKRYEKGLRRSEFADKLGVQTSLIRDWETDAQLPDDAQFRMVSSILGFNSGVDLPKPNNPYRVGFYTRILRAACSKR